MSVSEGHLDYLGYRTWYRVAGDLASDPVPLLALHGGPGSTHHYFAPLEGLAQERPVVVYDQLGCGSSDRPQDVEWSVAVFRDEVDAVRSQLGLERIHLLGTSWGGMLALEHVLSGAEGIVSVILSSTLASVEQWATEQLLLKNALPADIVEVLDRHELAATYDDPEYEQAMEAYFDRHFYRGRKPRPELELMNAEKARDVYLAMQGPNWSSAVAMTCAPTRSLPPWSKGSPTPMRSCWRRALTRLCSRKRSVTSRPSACSCGSVNEWSSASSVA